MPHPAVAAAPPARGIAQLALAQGLAVLAAAGAAALYARWLQPAQLASWLLALAVARAGVLLLEAGLKTALVRRGSLPDATSLRRLVRQSTRLALAGTSLVVLVATGLWAGGHIGAEAAWLLAICPAAYFCSHPPLPVALARLERARCFGPIGLAEGASLLLELALPAALLAAGLAPAPAFGVAVVLARALRTGCMLQAARRLPADAPAVHTAAAAAALWRDGASVQAVAALALLRDQMHLWLLGPWFGAGWAGLYALAGTACALASQVAVQTAARVALPGLRACPPALRWPMLLRQTRLLAITCLPPLALLPAWLAWADARLWAGAWAAALPLLPWMLLRMVAGVGLTTLGAGLLLAPGAWTAARTHAWWTGLELLLATTALALLGAPGLAVAGALGGWLGLLLFLRAATPVGTAWWPRLPLLLAALLGRPSLVLAVLLAAWVQMHVQVPMQVPVPVQMWPGALGVATLALPLCWLAEPAAWRLLAGLRTGLRAGARRTGWGRVARP